MNLSQLAKIMIWVNGIGSRVFIKWMQFGEDKEAFFICNGNKASLLVSLKILLAEVMFCFFKGMNKYLGRVYMGKSRGVTRFYSTNTESIQYVR